MAALSDRTARSAARAVARLAMAVVCLALVAAGKPATPAKPGAPAQNGGIEVKADVALLVDHVTGAVLFEKNPDKLFFPASLTKMMTVAVAFREVKEGRLDLTADFPVSEHAWRTGGAPSRTSAMFAPIHSRVTVSDLFQGIMIQSANDGAIALAEGLAGSEAAFAEKMNARAKELGMEQTNFANPTGLPDPGNRTTARDLVKLAAHLVRDHPDLYKIYAQPEFTYNKIRQFNRNPLLREFPGADGLKTGYIKESGYNLVGSAIQSGQRLTVVIGGAQNEKDRAEDARKLLDWGFRTFETVHLYGADEAIGEAAVFGGTASGVPVASPKPIAILIQKGNRDKLKARVVYSGPIKAPVAKGQPIGRLVVTRNDSVVQEIPVEALQAVEAGTLRQRAIDGTREILIGLLRR
ncbi:MAG: D-alanyl-D-alanine carboxypeptidase [Siculibacillus sp.]|nr:D-alanyl-D-alanine carboxypeptidase [Siculibacillus sp.]